MAASTAETDNSIKSVIVVGAGVIGLTTAITLLERFPHVRCKIVAEYTPDDDKHIDYASPWAGAHLVSHAKKEDKELIAMDRKGLTVMMQQYANKETGALFLIQQYEYFLPGADNGSDPDGVEAVGMPEFRRLNADELPEGVERGITFKTLTIDTPEYLKYLATRFKSMGGEIEKRKVKALRDVVSGSTGPLSLIVNCTGLGSASLSEVKDQAVYPVRGQLCLIRAPWMTYGKTFIGQGSTSYSIPRSSGIVVLGGTREADDWFTGVRHETSQSIRERAVHFDRNLLPPDKREHGTYLDLDLVEEGCGRRPARRGGPRVELSLDCIKDTPVLHNYGHAGYGWQTAWGYAGKAADMVDL